MEENRFKNVSDNWIYVGLAYLLTFGLWSAVAGHDYINSTRRTVKSTRRRGIAHLAFTAVPMTYMISYIIMQALGEDYKEMWTGCIALAFAILHLLRTLGGLWQLHVFKQWVVRSIKCLESLGYEALKKEKKERAKKRWNKLRDAGEEMRLFGRESCLPRWCPGVKQPSYEELEEERINLIADEVSVNETIVDNHLAEGDVRCSLRFFSKEDSANLEQAKSKLKHTSLMSRIILKNFLSIPYLLWTVVTSRTSAFSNSRVSLHLIPYKPEEIWLRWACALVAQVFPDWLKDMKRFGTGAESPRTLRPFETMRAAFTEQILLNAGLHSQFAASESSEFVDSRTKIVPQSGDRSKENQVPLNGFSRLYTWENYPVLSSGLFEKEEFLRNAYVSGVGFPFGVSHKKGKRPKHHEDYSYSKFEAKLARIREAMPADEEQSIREFGTHELEWLAVFLSIDSWRVVDERGTEQKKTEKASETSNDMNRTDESSSSSSSDTQSSTGVVSQEAHPEEYFAFTNLRRQINLREDKKYYLNEENMASFPLLKSCLSKKLWGNMLLMEPCAHIDNMLALCLGNQMLYMLDNASDLKNEAPWRIRSTDFSAGPNHTSQIRPDALQRICKSQIAAVQESQMFQFSISDPVYHFHEQQVTFLGCSIESLRCALARWFLECDSREQEWMPRITKEGEHCNEESLFTFQLSSLFGSWLDAIYDNEDFQEQFLQMRLLWELQNYFHERIGQADGISPDRHEAMILCLLSFPSLQIVVRTLGRADNEQDCVVDIGPKLEGGEQRKQSLGRFVLNIRAVCAPQEVFVELTLERKGRSWEACSKLIEEEDEPHFVWEAWRDAFYGRLEGMRQWQERHLLIPTIPVIKTKKRIFNKPREIKATKVGTGEKLNVWIGWMPYRTTMALFELQSEEFIQKREMVPYIIEGDYFEDLYIDAGFMRERRSPVMYLEADKADLHHASVIVDEVLQKLSSEHCKPRCLFSISGEEDILAKAQKMLEDDSKDQNRLGIQLALAMGSELNSFKFVENVAKLLTREDSSEDAEEEIWQALFLIESFFSSSFSHGGVMKSKRRLDDDTLASEIKRMLQELLTRTGYHRGVAESFAKICTSLKGHHDENTRKELVQVMSGSILRSLHFQDNYATRQRKVLGSMLPFQTGDHRNLCLQLLLGESDISSIGTEEIVQLAKDLLTGNVVVRNPDFAVNLLEYAVDVRKSIHATYTLAKTLRHETEGFPSDPPRAVGLFELVIESDVRYMHDLATLLRYGAKGVSQNPSRAAELYQLAIDKGEYVDSMIELAKMLTKGAGDVAADPPRAVQLLTRAIKTNNNQFAMILLACILKNGAPGVPQDDEKTIDLLANGMGLILDLGLSSFQLYLEEGIANDSTRANHAFDLLGRAMEKEGHLYLLLDLARILETGKYGAPEMMLRLRERLIDKHKWTWVRNDLALLLENGRLGIPADPKRAVEYYERSIQEAQDHVDYEMFNLAVLLQHGATGVSRDPVRAARLYEEAMKFSAQEAGAANNLGVLLEQGAPELEADTARAAKLYQIAIDCVDHSGAMFNLAVLLKLGAEGVPADAAKAEDLYRRAVKIGGPVCTENLNDDIELESVHELEDMQEDALEYVRAVEQDDDVVAMNKLAVLLHFGAPGVEEDPQRAARLYARAVWEGGHIGAMRNLSKLLQAGASGVPANPAEADRLLARSKVFAT